MRVGCEVAEASAEAVAGSDGAEASLTSAEEAREMEDRGLLNAVPQQ